MVLKDLCSSSSQSVDFPSTHDVGEDFGFNRRFFTFGHETVLPLVLFVCVWPAYSCPRMRSSAAASGFVLSRPIVSGGHVVSQVSWSLWSWWSQQPLQGQK